LNDVKRLLHLFAAPSAVPISTSCSRRLIPQSSNLPWESFCRRSARSMACVVSNFPLGSFSLHCCHCCSGVVGWVRVGFIRSYRGRVADFPRRCRSNSYQPHDTFAIAHIANLASDDVNRDLMESPSFSLRPRDEDVRLTLLKPCCGVLQARSVGLLSGALPFRLVPDWELYR
jgi:hypothetical protein